jgi:hypothetical protein
MKDFTETRIWDQVIRDAVEHRTLHRIYYEAGYREGVRDAERHAAGEDCKDQAGATTRA